MTMLTRTLLVAATIVAGASWSSEAHAGCGGGSFRRAVVSNIRSHYSSAPRQSGYYHQPSCSQSGYYPPGYQQPGQVIPQQPPVGQIPQQFPQQNPQQFPQQNPQQVSQPALPAQPTQPAQVPMGQQAPAGRTASQPQTGTGSAPAASAQMTALQALASMGGTAANPAPATPAATGATTPSEVGTWTATLSNGARVQLQLQADGTFNWVATNQTGRASSFSGSYSIAGGSLTLVRSTDNQKLAGTMTQNGSNAFNFKLAGANDNGLNFVRA